MVHVYCRIIRHQTVSCKITSLARKCGIKLFGDEVDDGGEQSVERWGGMGWGDDRDAIATRARGVYASPFICRHAWRHSTYVCTCNTSHTTRQFHSITWHVYGVQVWLYIFSWYLFYYSGSQTSFFLFKNFEKSNILFFFLNTQMMNANIIRY